MKNQRKFKISFFFEKLIPDLSFAIGFIKIHQQARFLQPIEVYQKIRFSDILPHFLKEFLKEICKNPKNLKSDFTLKIVTFDVDH